MAKKAKVLVAMSGGVDSSVTAALLQQQGYEIVGATMQIWDPNQVIVDGDYVGCCSLAAVDDARKVADHLEIPYYVLNFRELFTEQVIKYFVHEYLAGRTPNPCIACNRYVKFAALLSRARQMDFDYIATGHYARLGYESALNRYVLRKGLDVRKNQSYVLYSFTQDQLAHTLMPLGEYTKEQVRRLAGEMGLATAEKPESQEICFVNDDNYRNFLEEKTGGSIKPGPFLDLDGNVIGRHKGIPFYTIGQRRGLGLAMGEKVYVVDIDPERNAVVVGPEKAIWGTELIAGDNNFILMPELTEAMAVQAQIRYNAKPAPALLEPLPDGLAKVTFKEAQRSITPGQAVVFYQDDYVVGGGTIQKQCLPKP